MPKKEIPDAVPTYLLMPRKRVTAAAVADAPPAEFDYTASFQRFTVPDQFARFCAGYPNSGNAVSYVYRLFPKIDREQTGNRDTSIDKVSGEVADYDYLARKWGSGRYMLLFNDLAKPRDLQQVAKCTIEVDDPTLAPVLDPAELVLTDSKNSAVISKYLNMGWTVADAVNDLKPNGFKQLVPPASGGAERVLADAVTSLADRVASNASALPANSVVIDRDMLKELLGSARKGGDELDRAFQIADRLKPAEDKLTQVLVSKLADAAFAQRSNPAPAVAPAGDSVSTLKATIDFLREMGWSPSGEAAPVSGGMMRIFETALSQMALGFGQALAARYGGSLPALAPAATSVPELPGDEDDDDPEPIAETEDEVINARKVQALMAVGQHALEAFERGVTGVQFAQTLSGRPDTLAVYRDLVQMGKSGILTAIAAVPGLNERLTPRRAEYEAWLDAFLGYNQAGASI